MIVAGCVEVYMGSRAKDWRHFSLWVIAGVLYLAAGVMAIANPLLASVVFTLLLGAGLFAAGAMRLYLAFKLPASQARTMVMLSAFVTMSQVSLSSPAGRRTPSGCSALCSASI